MSKKKTEKRSKKPTKSPGNLLKDLNVEDAKAVRGGATVNKAKPADKAFSAMDGYIRG